MVNTLGVEGGGGGGGGGGLGAPAADQGKIVGIHK